jgi:hypothetical protein
MKFKPIPSTNNKYEVTEDGVLRNAKTKRINKGCISNGYKKHYLMMPKCNKPKMRSLHRLVFETWSGEELDKGMVIDHIDRDKMNNNISNLRQVPLTLNIKNQMRHIRNEHLALIGTTKKVVARHDGISFTSYSDLARHIMKTRNYASINSILTLLRWKRYGCLKKGSGHCRLGDKEIYFVNQMISPKLSSIALSLCNDNIK